MSKRLEGQIAIVTGASSGNGRAIAVALAHEGATVLCSDLRPAALSAGYESDLALPTHEAIRKAGGKADFQQADASKSADMKALVEKAVALFGRLDIMVNNAGVFTGLHSILDETEEQYDFTMNINAKGVWLGCKYAIGQMMAQAPRPDGTRGRIVNIASIAGLVGLVLEPAYCASKGAVVSLTRQLGIDYAPHRINVNAICPGFIATAMVRPFLEDKATNEALHAMTPYPRVGTAEDVAKLAVFLVSDDAEWICGTNMTLDGAFTAR